MGILRKNINDILAEYKMAKIEKGYIEIYETVKESLNKTLKKRDKIDKEYDKLSYEKERNEKKVEKIENKLKELKEEHPVKSMVAKIPVIGRLGKVGKEYKELKKKLKRAKSKIKVSNKNLKYMNSLIKKFEKQERVTSKDLKKCEKQLKKHYKKEKNNIKIAIFYNQNKDALKEAYGKEAFEYIKEYVTKVREGEKDIKLPKNIETEKDFMKKIKKDIKAWKKGKEIEPLVQEKESIESNNKEVEKKKQEHSVKEYFARRGLNLKRDYTAYKDEVNGTKIELSPEETLVYVGFLYKCKEKDNEKGKEILKYPKEKIVNMAKEFTKNAIEENRLTSYENRGYDEIYKMVEKVRKTKGLMDIKELNDVERTVYKIASNYVGLEIAEKEEKDKIKAQEQAQEEQRMA